METQLKETTKHILNDIDKHDADKIQNVLRARFLRDRDEQIESFFTSYKDNAFIPFPDKDLKDSSVPNDNVSSWHSQ